MTKQETGQSICNETKYLELALQLRESFEIGKMITF